MEDGNVIAFKCFLILLLREENFLCLCMYACGHVCARACACVCVCACVRQVGDLLCSERVMG